MKNMVLENMTNNLVSEINNIEAFILKKIIGFMLFIAEMA
jgi:hypothetical protein